MIDNYGQENAKESEIGGQALIETRDLTWFD
jgi:hypothetical protein